MNRLTPNYLSDILPLLAHETTTYNLRNSNHIQKSTRIQIFSLTLSFPLLSELGILFLMISNRPYPSPLSNRLNRDLKKPPRYHNIGTRIGHVRLRMGCSALTSHLYQKNSVPSPSCICGGFERVGRKTLRN